MEGVDYSGGAISAAALKGAGKQFAVCYVVPGRSVSMGAAEYRDHRDNGILQLGIWERAANRSLAGFAAGATDMREAMSYVASIGGPTDAVLYIIANDWDVTEAEKPAVLSYIQGAASVRSFDLTGAYGSYWVIKYLAEHNACKYYWQTYAWSGGLWHPAAQLQQYANSAAKIGGVDVDYDRSTTALFGQWGASPVPSPVSDPANSSAIGEGTMIVAQRPNAGTFHAFAIGVDGQIWGVQWGGVFSSIDGNPDEYVLNPKWKWQAYGGDPIPGSLAGAWSNDGRFFRLFHISRAPRADGNLHFMVKEFDALPNKWSDWAELPNAATAPQFALTPGPAGPPGPAGAAASVAAYDDSAIKADLAKVKAGLAQAAG